MAFFKKLVPGKNSEKEGNGSAQVAPPSGEQGARAQGNGTASPAASGQPLAGTHDEFAGRMDQLLREDGVKSSPNRQLSNPDEAGGRLRSAANAPNLAVSPDADMLQLLSDQAGLKYVRLGDYPKTNITPDLLKHVPSQIARDYKVFPVELRPDGTIVIAISDPLNVQIVDTLRLMLVDREIHNVDAVVAREEEIIDYINLFYGVGDKTIDEMVEEFMSEDQSSGLEQRDGVVEIGDLDKLASEPPIIRFCNLLLLQAIKERASDLHIEPFSGTLRIRYRVDGALREVPAPPKSWQLGILSRFKVMASLDIAETRRPQDGRLKLTVDGREIDCRVSCLPVVHGECLVMRLLDKSMMQIGVDQIGMNPEVLEKFMKAVHRPNGILLVTGPTGSGKTTTLYAALNEINEPTEKIITTEDPVEYQLDGIVQVNINTAQGLTFARCLRAILRQDPDVILVGEIRDVETAQIAVQASLTGHLVLSTLHTNSAAATISRLVDMGIEPFLITSCLEGVVAQRLVRTICPNCRAPYRPTPEELAEFGATYADVSDITFYRGAGCDDCGQSGFRGRLGIFEFLAITDEVKNLILERATTDDVHALALEQGMQTMRQDGWVKICVGLTTFEEVAKHTPREDASTIRKEMKSVLQETSGHAEQDAAPSISMSAIQRSGMTSPSSPEEIEAAAPYVPQGDGSKPAHQ